MNTGLEKLGTGEGAQSESGAFGAGQWRQHTLISAAAELYTTNRVYTLIDCQSSFNRPCTPDIVNNTLSTVSEASTVYQQC